MPDNTKNSILEANNVTVGYINKHQKKIIAKGINFSVNKGELIALVGANGIGKSTLLKTLARVIPSIEGNLLLNQKSIKKYTQHELAKTLSLVLTEPVVNKNLNVTEIISLGRQPYTNWIGNLTFVDIAKIKDVIEKMGLNEIRYTKCYELSDGQLQKVMIARAMAQNTPIMLLDEPTTHLDIYHKAYILKLLQHISHTTQTAILYSTHEIDVALQICDKMLIMTSNKVHFNTPANLISQGVFNNLFPKDLILFDEQLKKFIVNK